MTTKQNITVRDLEQYTTEVTRAHVRQAGYRMFQHPNATSAMVMVKDNEIVGIANRYEIVRDNAKTRALLNEADFMPVVW